MRILFDGHWWFDGPPSGQNVLHSLVSVWSRQYPDDQIVVEIQASDMGRQSEVIAGSGNIEVKSRPFKLHPLNIAARFGLAGKYDSYVSQNFVSPFSRQHRTVFVHDAMFQEHKDWFSRKELLYLSLIPALMRSANLVLTSSHAEAERIKRLNPRLRVTPSAVGLAVPTAFQAAPSIKPESKLEPSKFLLAVGRLNIRKNLNLLAGALEKGGVISPNFPLVVVGTADGAVGDNRAITGAVSRGSVVMLGGLSNSHLKWLYENCAVFTFPSLDEGFGLPVLEARSAGAKLALSEIPSFVELGGQATYFDPHDAGDIAHKVRAALESADPNDSETADSDFTWEKVIGRVRAEIVRDRQRGKS